MINLKVLFMILIDTSVWIEFLKSKGASAVKHKVAELLELNMAAYSCPIRFELLTGARKTEKLDIYEALSFSRHIVFKPLHWDKAAEMESLLRKKGITIPRDDIFVAVCALDETIPILHIDKHFEMIAEYFPLKTVSML